MTSDQFYRFQPGQPLLNNKTRIELGSNHTISRRSRSIFRKATIGTIVISGQIAGSAVGVGTRVRSRIAMETVRGGGVLQSLLSDWEVGRWTDVTLVGEDNTRSVRKALSLQGDSGRNGNMSGAGTSKKYTV